MRTFRLSSSSNSPGRFSGRDFQGGEGIGLSSGSLITRNGVCFTVSLMPVVGGGIVSGSDSSAGESGRRSSQRAGARRYGAGPLALEERGGMEEEAKGTISFAPLSLFVHHMSRSIFNRDSAAHSPLTYISYLSYSFLSCVLSAPPRLHPTPTQPLAPDLPLSHPSITRSKKEKMGTKPEKKNEAHSV